MFLLEPVCVRYIPPPAQPRIGRLGTAIDFIHTSICTLPRSMRTRRKKYLLYFILFRTGRSTGSKFCRRNTHSTLPGMSDDSKQEFEIEMHGARRACALVRRGQTSNVSLLCGAIAQMIGRLCVQASAGLSISETG